MSRSLAALSIVIAGGVALVAFAPPVVRDCSAYVVTRGDTLGRIARRCGSTVAAIAAASRIADPNLILIGQRLVIPGRESFARAVAPAPRLRTTAEGRLSYAMAPGDTLYSLARWSRVTVPALLAANPGVDPRRIEIGDTIRLPGHAASPLYARLRERGPGAAPAPRRPEAAQAPARVPADPGPAPPPARARERGDPVGM